MKKDQIKEKIKNNKKYRKINYFLVSLIIITGFILIVSFSVFYASSVIYNGNVCNCIVPIPLLILLLSSLGFFVGAIVSFLYGFKLEKERNLYEMKIKELILSKTKSSDNQNKIKKTNREIDLINIHKLLSLILQKDEFNVLNKIMDYKYENNTMQHNDRWKNIILQSNLEKELNISRVKLHRILKKYEILGIIKKIKYGKTFQIILNPNLFNANMKSTLNSDENE